MDHSRKSLRLKDFDYTQLGPYFVTLVTRQREPLFGSITSGRMQVNAFGKIVADTW
jgi:putative transposase